LGSSRWAHLLVRAAASGLLDTSAGCPINAIYLIREAYVLKELMRQDDEKTTLDKMKLDEAAAQIFTTGMGETVQTKMFEASQLRMQYSLELLKLLREPWDSPNIIKQLNELRNVIADKGEEIGDTGITPSGLVKMVRAYEEEKKRRQQKRTT